MGTMTDFDLFSIGHSNIAAAQFITMLRAAGVEAIAEAAGGRITRPAQAAFWGGRTGYFEDPDGHLWEVAWNPHFPLGEDGALRLPL